jgi:hypothetical protein
MKRNWNFYLRLGSFGDGSLELQVELLSERHGLDVEVVVALEPRLLRHLYMYTHTHAHTHAWPDKQTHTTNSQEGNRHPQAKAHRIEREREKKKFVREKIRNK